MRDKPFRESIMTLAKMTTLVFAYVMAAAAVANNNLFLPGDAFFPTELTEERLRQLEEGDEGPPVFEYSSFGGYEGAFCGYAGYNRAGIPAVNADYVANLRRAYDNIREYDARRLIEMNVDGKTVLVETNGVRVLFYPEEFRFPQFQIGLRYNERWVEEAVKFGHQRQTLRLCCLVDDKEAVMLSWRDAAVVAPLPVLLPDVPMRPVPATEAPVTVEGPVKAIVLDSGPLVDYLRPKDFEADVLIVDTAGVKLLHYEEGRWKTFEPDE